MKIKYLLALALIALAIGGIGSVTGALLVVGAAGLAAREEVHLVAARRQLRGHALSL